MTPRSFGAFAQRFMKALPLESTAATPLLPDDALRALLLEADKMAPDAAKNAAIDLIALAIELKDRGGELADALLGQVFVLVASLIGVENAQRGFEKAGLAADKALAAVGAAVAKNPVATSSIASGKSLMAFRLGVRNEDGDE